jgi:peptide/nickel transport system substrate-binding protein
MDKANKTYITLFAIAAIAAILFGSFNKVKPVNQGSLDESLKNYDAGKKLVIGRANDSVTLDPACTTDLGSFKVTVNILETLVKYEEDGEQIVPCLAESWESSEDGLTWVFKLRQGVRFHDNTVFNAQSVAFNFQRWMDVHNPYHSGSFSYWNYIFGGFPGFVKSVTALSDYTLEIRLNKPYAPFLNALAMPVFGIASPEAIKMYGDDLSEHPVGTGPFVLTVGNGIKALFSCETTNTGTERQKSVKWNSGLFLQTRIGWRN